jgi:hypothetical protein
VKVRKISSVITQYVVLLASAACADNFTHSQSEKLSAENPKAIDGVRYFCACVEHSKVT